MAHPPEDQSHWFRITQETEQLISNLLSVATTRESYSQDNRVALNIVADALGHLLTLVQDLRVNAEYDAEAYEQHLGLIHHQHVDRRRRR